MLTLLWNVQYAFHHHLVCSIVHKNIDGAHGPQRLAIPLICEVCRHQVALSAILLDLLLRLLSIRLFLRQTGDEAVGTLYGEESGDRTPNAAVATSNQGLLSQELSRRFVDLVSAALAGTFPPPG